MNLQEGFLKALEENEDDTATRLIYADWLDENNQPEEAARQRAWPEAKRWMLEFVRENNYDAGYYECRNIDYNTLIELARESIEGSYNYPGFSCGNNETMCDALRNNKETFWKNWSIITGIALPEGFIKACFFSCAC